MQRSGVRQRQRQQEQQEQQEPAGRPAAPRLSADVRLSVSLMSLSVCVVLTWLQLQQGAQLSDISQRYEHLREESRGVRELRAAVDEASLKLQASSSSALKHAVSSIHNSSAVLQAEQEASSLLLHTLSERVRSATEAWQSGRAALSDELDALKTRSRAAHAHVTELVNDVDARLRELSERLQEVQDGTGRNTRVLDRTEEEDAGRVRDQLDWNERRVSRLQEQLQRLSAQGRELRQRLETSAPHTRRWQDTHLPAAEEAVRSMLRVRAQLSATHRRLEELQLQVRRAEERCALASSPSVSQTVAQLQERFSSLSGQRQQLQLNLSALAQAVESVEQHAAQVSSDTTSRLASIRTDVRRMAGLETEVEVLLNQTQALEEKVAQTEKLMVKRIGDLLAGSIDRVSALKSSAERSGQRLDQISALVHQLSEANRQLSEQILALESGQAKLLKTATFASDLKPKVFSIRQDFAIIEPKLDDLTLRIGLLAEDLMSREEERSERSDETTHHTLDQKDQLTP